MFGLEVSYPNQKYLYASTDLGAIVYTFSKCPECGRNCASPSLPKQRTKLIVEGGKEYPDFLYYGGPRTRVYVSKRVKDIFDAKKITGYKVEEPVEVYRYSDNQIVNDNVEYYSLDIFGCIDLNLKSMQLRKKRICQTCNQWDWSRQRLYLLKPVFDYKTWDNSDLCKIKSFPGKLMCTENVKRLALEHNFTGLSFRNEEDIFKRI